jgi:hypothetical protein
LNIKMKCNYINHLNGLSNMDEINLTWIWHPLIHDQRWNSTIMDFGGWNFTYVKLSWT